MRPTSWAPIYNATTTVGVIFPHRSSLPVKEHHCLMVERQKARENDEWSSGSRGRIQLSATAPERVCHNSCTRHLDEDQQQRSIQIQIKRKQALLVDSESGCGGTALACREQRRLTIAERLHFLCDVICMFLGMDVFS